MISDDGKWHCFAVTKLSAVLRSLRSKCNDDFYSLYCLHSLRTKIKLTSHKKVWKIVIFVMLKSLMK